MNFDHLRTRKETDPFGNPIPEQAMVMCHRCENCGDFVTHSAGGTCKGCHWMRKFHEQMIMNPPREIGMRNDDGGIL